MPLAPGGPAVTLGFVQQWMNLLALLKYGLVFAVLLVFLPLTAFEHVPAHGLLGGLFVDLTAWEIFFTTLALLGVAWCVMFGEGLVISGVERWSRHGQAYRPYADVIAAPSGYVPAWAEAFFCVIVTPAQFFFFTLLAVPGSWVIVKYGSGGRGPALLALAAGLVVGYLLLILLCTPAALVDWTNRPAQGLWLADPLWARLRGKPRLLAAARALHRWVSWLPRKAGMTYVLDAPVDGQPRLLYAPQFNGVTATAGLAVVVAAVALFFSPVDLLSRHMKQGESAITGEVRPEQSVTVDAPAPTVATGVSAPADRSFPRQLVAVVYLYVMLMALVLLLTALQLHLGSLRISPLAVVLLVMLVGYSWRSVDHLYRIRPGAAPADVLDPVAVVKAGPRGPNLVVVVASGGGILAAGWTTLAIEKLTEARPQIQGEIRLLSTISGGSVGAAYYIDSMLRGEPAGDAHVKSVESSLADTAYGFAFLDLPRLLTGSLVSFRRDRGLLLEQAWLATANGRVSDSTVHKTAAALEFRPLRSLRGPIAAGKIPAPIFATTVMESGRRVMSTPVDFGDSPGRKRADTLSEYLAADRSGYVDVDLWTAARLSATFAFVSPAARANGPVDKNRELPTDHRAHHFIDGGYYDNFGVTSALDWLDPVLEARATDADLGFERVLVVQLRAFRRGDPRETKAASGAGAALLGPLLGLAAIRDGAAVSRNDIELNRFVRRWKDRYQAKAPPGGPVEICVATLQPPPGSEGPLSWHLTRDDKRRLRTSWSPDDAAKVTAYLDGKGKGQCESGELTW
jgi:hypothetical protein